MNLELRQENEDLQSRLVVYMEQVEQLSAKLKYLQQRSSVSSEDVRFNNLEFIFCLNFYFIQ